MRMLSRTAACIMLVAAAAVTLSGSYVSYPVDGIYWYNSPSDAAVGDCFGNCGAGCSDGWNPCGGRTQYWQLVLTSTPQEIPNSEWTEQICDSNSNTLYTYDRALFSATGHWTYYGFASVGCADHDSICPEFLWGLGCVAFEGCGTGWNEEWGYDDSNVVGRGNLSGVENGSCDGGGGGQ